MEQHRTQAAQSEENQERNETNRVRIKVTETERVAGAKRKTNKYTRPQSARWTFEKSRLE